MARARKSHVSGEENTKSRKGGMELPYSPSVSGHRYVIYCSYHPEGEKYPRTLVLKFLATYAALWFVSKLIGKDEVQWEKWIDRDAMIRTSSGITIRAANDQLKEIYEYEPTEEEAAWRDESVISSINAFRYGRAEGSKLDQPEIEPEGDGEPDTRLRKHRTKDPKPAREKKPKVDKSGYISANDIAKELKVEGREVRAVLRGLGLSKPDIGWMWLADSKELKDAKAAITKGLAEVAKKKGRR